MALVKCKECGKEMSDTIKKCPHCGYREKRKLSKKLILIVSAVLTVLIIGGIFAGITINKQKIAKQQQLEKEYNELLVSTGAKIYINGIVAELFCYDIGQVWYKAIFDKFSYHDNYYKYSSSDFNESIKLYRIDNEKNMKNLIEEKNKLGLDIKKLKKLPNEEYKESYEAMVEYYGTFSKLVDAATSPSGTYRDYIQSYNSYSSDFKKNYDTVIVLVPDIKNYKDSKSDKK